MNPPQPSKCCCAVSERIASDVLTGFICGKCCLPVYHTFHEESPEDEFRTIKKSDYDKQFPEAKESWEDTLDELITHLNNQLDLLILAKDTQIKEAEKRGREYAIGSFMKSISEQKYRGDSMDGVDWLAICESARQENPSPAIKEISN